LALLKVAMDDNVDEEWMREERFVLFSTSSLFSSDSLSLTSDTTSGKPQ
jgi:hypothetical protein